MGDQLIHAKGLDRRAFVGISAEGNKRNAERDLFSDQ
jgi:hypothetical protein